MHPTRPAGRSPTALVLLGITATGAGILLTGPAPALAVVAAQPVAGAGNAVETIGFDTLVQDLVPRPLLGRVFGIVGTAAQVGAAMAYAAGGLLVDVLGARATFVAAGTATLVVAFVIGARPGRPPQAGPAGA